MMVCPNCKEKKTEFLESREFLQDEKTIVIDYYYCWDCDYLWKMEDGNFTAGAVVYGGEQDFPSFDDMEIIVVRNLNLKDLEFTCIFCGDTALKNPDKNTYECPKCGGSWEVV